MAYGIFGDEELNDRLASGLEYYSFPSSFVQMHE